jgi:Na+-driven multidrug efflux pump
MATGWTTFSIVRVILDLLLTFAFMPLFMTVLGFGILGPLAAGGLSTALLSLVIWRAIKRHGARLGLGTFSGRYTAVDLSYWGQIFGIGLPPVMGRLAAWFAQGLYIQLLAHGAPGTVGGYGLGFQLMFIVGNMGLNIAFGSAIMVGQNVGAGQWQRCLGVIRRAAILMGILLALFIMASPFARPLFRLFSDDPAVQDSAMAFVSIMKWGWIGMMTYQLLTAVYTAVGATKLAGTFAVIAEVVGVVFALGYPGSAFEAVAYAFCITAAVKAVLLLSLIRHALIRPLRAARSSASAEG